MEIKNKELFKQKCFINGEWVNANNNEKIEVNNPATLKIIGSVPKCGKEETRYAISIAFDAWKDWRERTALDRSNILRKWNDLILENQEDLARIMTIEQGKPLQESMGEIAGYRFAYERA